MGGEGCVYRIRVSHNGVLVSSHVMCSQKIVIGRSPECGIAIRGRHVSRTHAQLEQLGGGRLLVRDLDSMSGTFVNKRRVQECEIAPDFILTVGDYEVEVCSRDCLKEPAAESPLRPVMTNKDGEGQSNMAGTPTHNNEVPVRDESDICCPRCWHKFPVEKILAVAQHSSLIGDPVLGSEAHQRFLPTRFTPGGHAIDVYGVTCPDLACPRCHLTIPQSLTQRMPFFFSVIGAPSSGKSYWITSMIWELRRVLPANFGFAFNDADPTSNDIVNSYEKTLFLCKDEDAWVALEKTEMEGHMYDRVRLQNMDVLLPRPLMFALHTQPHHPWYERLKRKRTYTLVMYDNAGEHFERGRDTAASPGTRHLVRSDGMFFLFDPTMDRRFRAEVQSTDPQMRPGARVETQEILLTEAISRIKLHTDPLERQNLDRPVVVIVTKCDIWQSLLNYRVLPNPYRRTERLATAVLDLDIVGSVSLALRHLLQKVCPEVVATVESFSSRVTYVPVSALGHSPGERRDRMDTKKRVLAVQPRNIKPLWASVPMIVMLSHFGLIPMVLRRQRDRLPVVSNVRVSGNLAILKLPGTDQRLEIPAMYVGRSMRCPLTGKWYWILPSQGDQADTAGPSPAR